MNFEFSLLLDLYLDLSGDLFCFKSSYGEVLKHFTLQFVFVHILRLYLLDGLTLLISFLIKIKLSDEIISFLQKKQAKISFVLECTNKIAQNIFNLRRYLGLILIQIYYFSWFDTHSCHVLVNAQRRRYYS